MLSFIVTESISNKNQIMNILSDNYHAIFISIITVLITILIAYTFRYYYRYRINNNNNNNNKNNNLNRNRNLNKHLTEEINLNNPTIKQKQNVTMHKKKINNKSQTNKPIIKSHNPKTKPQPQQQQKRTPPFVPKTTISRQMTLQNDMKRIASTPCIRSIPSGIPDQIDFSPQKNNYSSTYKSLPKQTTETKPKTSFIKDDSWKFNFTSNTQPLFNKPTMDGNTNNGNGNGNNNGSQELETIAKITKRTTIKFDGSKEQPTVIIEEETTIKAAHCWSKFIQGLRIGVSQDQGKRDHMENSTSIIEVNKSGDNATYSFGVWDGHLGNEAAEWCSTHLHKHVSENIQSSTNNIEDHIRRAFHQTDDEFKQYAINKECEAGAVGVYVYYTHDCIYVANVGDCRAILCSNGKLKSLTIDHNPKNEDEKKRCGKCIDNNSDLLSGQISVTRAIGDYYKSNNMEKLDGLICDPYISKHILTDQDEFLVLACDGLWDVLDDKSVMKAARQSLRNNGDVYKAAQKLIKLAAKKSVSCSFDAKDAINPLTSDNISVMVIGFANKDKETGKLHIGPKREEIPRPPGGFRRRRFNSRKRANSHQ